MAADLKCVTRRLILLQNVPAGRQHKKKKEATPRQNSLSVSSARGQSAESNACLTIKILKVVLELKKVPGKFKGSPLPVDPSSFREYKLLVQPRES